MNDKAILKNAPARQDSPEFLEYLRKNNEVVFENAQWIVIKNRKYYTKAVPWLTAFHKPKTKHHDWYQDIDILWYHEDWGTWEWRKKALIKQTVPGRFHIHLIKKQ